MKKWIILVLVFAGLSAQAQRPSLQLKAYVGVHVGKWNTKLEEKIQDIAYGYQGGFSLRVSKGRAFLEPSFNFLRSHFEIPDTIAEGFNALGIADPGVNLNSFEFPVVVGYKFVKTPLFKWYVAGGFKLSVSLKSAILDGDEVVVKLKGKDLGLKNPHFSMRMGSGVDIAFFTIEFYYSLGLNNAFTSVYRGQTHNMQLNFGFLF